jgi:two-component system OmpR family response regulator/two-component system response regulator RstA
MDDSCKKYTLLLVEDDEALAEVMQEYLEKHDFKVEIEHRGDRAVTKIRTMLPDLVILDIMLPVKDGFTVCREIRPTYSGPVLMLTARDEDMDQVVGLELGADDYICKPVQPRLLLARIHAVLRRLRPGNHDKSAKRSRFEFGGLVINKSSREVIKNGLLVDLTTAEFDLLFLLANHAGKILSREAILQKIRGIDYDGIDRSIDLRISRLRKKLGDDPECPGLIKTVRGRGYLFAGEL